MAKKDIAMQVLQQVVKLPVVKVDREKFLVEKFSKELGHKNLNKLIEQGPATMLPKATLDRVAKTCIKDNVDFDFGRFTWWDCHGYYYSH